ncbi:MAG TPA: BamA/TamA family outer membrane protein [Longimicrobiales bacterium]
MVAKVLGARGAQAPAVFALVMTPVLLLVACGLRTRGAEPYPELADFAGREIEAVEFVGGAPFAEDTLQDLVETRETRCDLLGLPVCIPGTKIGRTVHRLNLETLRRDVLRLERFYRRRGYFGTRVQPTVQPVEDTTKIGVTFLIERGDGVVLDTLVVEGTEGIFDPDSLARTLPLRPGELFDLGEFEASADTILRALLDRGYAYARVLRSYDADTVTDRATAWLTAFPGPPVVVDSIVVLGAETLGRRSVLRQLTFRKGDLLRARELIESQRNLYSLELVQLASVAMAPDSLQVTPSDSARATVVVRIVEAPEHQVDAAVGFGTVECFRLATRWVDRSFMGGARRLQLAGSVSKLGIAGPLNLGLGKSACTAYRGDDFGDDLDYRLAADFTQPYLGSPRNHLTLSAFVERGSEPNVFQREAQGGRIAVARRVTVRGILTAALEAEHGRTIVADSAVFCLALEVCDPAVFGELARPRWRNVLGLDWTEDRRDQVLDPTRGTLVRAGLAWAAPWLASDVDFVRSTGELSRYWTLRPEWVLAASVRVGTFFGTGSVTPGDPDFLPPEERLYAGGANSVRGYGRNELGPGLYIAEDAQVDTATGTVLLPTTEGLRTRFIPIGGTSLLVANLELRVPSFFARDRVRLAAFVDVGAVDTAAALLPGGLKITPGVGIRLATPVGPARLDVAYNPYDFPEGPLFVPDPRTGALVRVRERFSAGSPGSFLDRFRIHLAVGQAF